MIVIPASIDCQIKLHGNTTISIPCSKIAEITMVLNGKLIFAATTPVNKNKKRYCQQEETVGYIEKIHNMGKPKKNSAHQK
jgi:hypothetical protein